MKRSMRVVQGKDKKIELENIIEHFRQGYWDVVSPDNAGAIAGIGYIFARRIHMATQIPIGIVDVSRGGTSLVTWTPTDVLKTIDTPEVKKTLADWDKNVSEFNPQKDLENRIRQYNDWVARLKADGRQVPADSKVPSEPLDRRVFRMQDPGLFAGHVRFHQFH